MRTARRSGEPRRVPRVGLLLTALAFGVVACSGPPSHEPSPKNWEDDGERPPARGQVSGNGGGDNDGGSSGGGDSGDGSTQVELCTTVDVATVQQSFGAPEEPTTAAGEETLGMEGLTAIGGCAYEWAAGEAAGSLTITAAVAESSDDTATYLEGLASGVGLSGDPIEGFGDASLLDTSGSVQADAAVAVGGVDVEGTKTVVVMVGPPDADPSAYAEVGSTVLNTVAGG